MSIYERKLRQVDQITRRDQRADTAVPVITPLNLFQSSMIKVPAPSSKETVTASVFWGAT
jgi:hypothetical protein